MENKRAARLCVPLIYCVALKCRGDDLCLIGDFSVHHGHADFDVAEFVWVDFVEVLVEDDEVGVFARFDGAEFVVHADLIDGSFGEAFDEFVHRQAL